MPVKAAPLCIIVHGVVASAPSPDEADTLIQVAEFAEAAAALGCAVEELAVGLDLAPLAGLAARRPAVVVNMAEALAGRGRLVHVVPAALEAFGLAVTGCSSTALLASSNKPFAKNLMRDAGIPTPDWRMPGEAADGDATWIVKSSWEHASIGLDAGSVLPGPAVPAKLADRRARFGGEWFAERWIDGREFNVGLLGGRGAADPQVLPIAEMTFVDFPPDAPRMVDYAAKWDPESPAFHNTVRRFDLPAHDAPLIAELADISRACWRRFGLSGYARVDFRVDPAGRPWVLEINANPCLAKDAGFIAAADRAGLTHVQVVARVLAAAGVKVGAPAAG